MINTIIFKEDDFKKIKNAKLLVTDIDGTLLRDDGSIGNETKLLLEMAFGMGIHIAIATGRSLESLPKVIYDLPCFEYVITGNGTCIYHMPDKKLVYDCKMPSVLARKILSVFRESGFQTEIVINGKSYVSKVYFENPLILDIPESMVSYVQNTRFPVNNIYQFAREHIDEIESIVLIIDDMKKKEKIRKDIELFEDIYVTTSAAHYIECNQLEARKGHTMKKLGKILGVTVDEIIAFGDSENDIDMIECAGIGVAMGNAEDAVKNAAQIITLDNNSEGIAYVLKTIIDSKGYGEC